MRNIGEDITIYDASGAAITVAPFTSGSIHKAELMKEDYITVKFIFESFVSFGVGCYAMHEGKKYILRNAYEPDRNSDGLYVYELRFDTVWMRLGDLILFYTNTGVKEAEWSLTGNPAAFIQLIVDYAKKMTGLNYVIGTVTPTTSITVSFSSTNILDALTAVAKACSEAESYTSQAEWWFDGLTLNLTRCEVGTRVDFVEGDAVQRMEPQKSDSDEEFTRLYAFGSTRNIPENYREGTEDELYATISKRLRIPIGTPYIDSKEGLTDDEVIEAVKLFEDIYPREIIPITGILYADLTDENNIAFRKYYIKQDTLTLTAASFEKQTPSITFQTGRLAGRTFEVKYFESFSDPNLLLSSNREACFSAWKQRIGYLTGCSNQVAYDSAILLEFNSWINQAALAFNSGKELYPITWVDYGNAGGPEWSHDLRYWDHNDTYYHFWRAHNWIKYNGTALPPAEWPGMSRDPGVYADTPYQLLVDSVKSVWDTTSEGSLFEIINTVTGTTYMPNTVLFPEVGAMFVLFNFDISLVSNQYISDAENELLAAAQEYMAYNLSNKKNYSCPTNAPYCAQNGVDLEIGRKVRLNGAVFGTYRDSRVYSFEKALDTPGKATYLVGDSSNYSKSKALDSKVDVLSTQVYNQLATIGGLKLIKVLDSTRPTDSSVFSSTRTLLEIQKATELSISIPLNEFGQTIGLDKQVVEGSAVLSVKTEPQTDEGKQAGHVAIKPNALGQLYGDIKDANIEINSQKIGDYQQGLSGAQIDEHGNAELESLKARGFIETPEFRYNRITINVGDKWNAPGGGIIESVDTISKIITLKLEEGEIGAVAENDICMGIFHSTVIEQNDTTTTDDSKGNRTFAGFYTCYFRIVEILEAGNNSQFRYELRPVSANYPVQYHPSTAMHFVGYGNFTDTARQTSKYETRTYERYLKGVNTWEQSVTNIVAQFGDLANLTVHGLDMAGYSIYLNNIYMVGTIQQFNLADPLRLEIGSSLGLMLGPTETTNITVTAWKGWVNLTSSVTQWVWTRDSGNSVEDIAWNNAHTLWADNVDLSYDDLGDTVDTPYSCLFTITAYYNGNGTIEPISQTILI